MSEDNSQRPARTLRDRDTYRHINTDNLGNQIHTDYIKAPEKPVKPVEYIQDTDEDDDIITPAQTSQQKQSNYSDDSKSYLDRLDEEEEKKKELEAQKNPKSKVKVLNLRKQSVSTKNIKEESKEEIKKTVKKINKQIEDVEETIEEAKENITKVKDKIKNNVSVMTSKASLLGVKIAETMITAPKNFILHVVFRKKRPETQQSSSTQQKTKFKEPPKTKYSQILAKKIKFVAYNKEPLVFSDELTGDVLEEVFMANAISDIRYCSKFVTELPMPEKGVYASKRISDVFNNIMPQDINRFLYYVSNNPEAFVGQNYKLSEAFATWILRKSHLL